MVALSGKGWKLAPSLVKLMNEVDAQWPKRSKTYDGSIGDDAHAARKSEHNPDRDSDDMPFGYVSAVDITKDSAAMAKTLLTKLIGDERVWYVIHDGFIYSRSNSWRKEEYHGTNAHEHHLHVSLRQTRVAANSDEVWGVHVVKPPIKPEPKPEPTPVTPAEKPKPTKTEPKELIKLATGVTPGKRHPQVRLLQDLLIRAGYGPIQGGITNFYGQNTMEAVARFHRKNRHLAEGSYDPKIGPRGFAELQREVAAKKR